MHVDDVNLQRRLATTEFTCVLCRGARVLHVSSKHGVLCSFVFNSRFERSLLIWFLVVASAFEAIQHVFWFRLCPMLSFGAVGCVPFLFSTRVLLRSAHGDFTMTTKSYF